MHLLQSQNPKIKPQHSSEPQSYLRLRCGKINHFSIILAYKAVLSFKPRNEFCIVKTKGRFGGDRVQKREIDREKAIGKKINEENYCANVEKKIYF